MFIKLTKFIIISMITTAVVGQGLVGEYRLIGLNVVDYDFCRQSTDIVVTEKSGFDLSEYTIYTVEQGENIDYDIREPYPLFALNAAGVDLWVYFSEDGNATLLEGSTYPTESAGEGCFTEEITLPIQEDFTYDVDFNSNEHIPFIDILGLESSSPYKGLKVGTISISGSSVFDIVPIIPTELSMPFPIDTSSVFNNDNGVIPADTILPGVTGGYVIKSTEMYSFIDYLEYDPNGFFFNEDNPPPRPSLYLEWHAIDGPVNESGLGDLIGVDEDGDGTDFDSIYGLDKIKITKVYSTDECGLNSYDIAGNHLESLRTVKYNQCLNDGGTESTCSSNADNWIDTCINFDDIDDEGNNLYVMNLENDPNFNWGGYVTWNSMRYYMTQDPAYLIDDSNENFNSTCMNDGDNSDCSGRIIFEYAPQCIPSFNMRYFMAELQEQCQESDKDECGVCFGSGIPEGYCDCYFGYRDCNGNCDEDPSNDDLSCFGCDEVANSGLEYDCLGLCGGDAYLDTCGVCDSNPENDGSSCNLYTHIWLENAGSETIEVHISNDSPISGFQFDIQGMNLETNGQGQGGIAEESGFGVYTGPNGVLSISFEGNSLPPSNGLLTTLSGTYFSSAACILEESLIIVYSDTVEGFEHNTVGDCLTHGLILGCPDDSACNYDSDATGNDGTCEYIILGDVNEDCIIDILDIVSMVSIIMEFEYSEVADINEDGILDILDIITMINIIINQ